MHSLPLFAGVSEDTLLALCAASRQHYVAKGVVLFTQSDSADAFYIVQSGKIAIVLASADGRELVINEMRPGDCFGELGLLTGQARSASAVARIDSRVIVVPRLAFQAIIDDDPHLMRRLLDITARRLSTSSERESALAFMDAEARLARALLASRRAGEREGLHHHLAGRAGAAGRTDPADRGLGARSLAAPRLDHHRAWPYYGARPPAARVP